jgi:hypothetical protein
MIDTMVVIRGARAFRQQPPVPTTPELRLLLGWVVIPRDPEHRHLARQVTAENTVLAPAVEHHDTPCPARIDDRLADTDRGNQVLSVGVMPGDILLPYEDLPEHTPLVSQALRECPGIDPDSASTPCA